MQEKPTLQRTIANQDEWRDVFSQRCAGIISEFFAKNVALSNISTGQQDNVPYFEIPLPDGHKYSSIQGQGNFFHYLKQDMVNWINRGEFMDRRWKVTSNNSTLRIYFESADSQYKGYIKFIQYSYYESRHKNNTLKCFFHLESTRPATSP